MSNQDALARKIAVGELDLTKTEHRVWNALLWLMEKGNYVYHTRPHMASAISLPQSHFNAAIRSLHAKDMIAYAADRGKGKSIMVSPFEIWKGGAAAQRMAMHQYRSHREKTA